MPDKSGPKDLEMVLAKLQEEWRELADLLISKSNFQDRVIEVEKILLRDASGEYFGKISANPDGSSDLLLNDRSGKAWARLGINQDGEAFLELKDKQGESSFKVGVGAPGPGAGAGLRATPGDAANPDSPGPISAAAAATEPSGASAPGLTPPPAVQDLHQEGDADSGAMDRLGKLERQNRRQKIYWVLILAVLGVILAVQAYVLFRPLPSGLAGETLMVRDANGKVRASLGIHGGKVGLELWDQEGHRRASLGLGSQGAPHLAFYDRDQRVRAQLNLGPDGEPKFTLRDKPSLQGKTAPHDLSDSRPRPPPRGGGPYSEALTATSPLAGQGEGVSPNQAAEAEIEVVGSKTSNKYHYPSCKWVKWIKPWNLIKFKSPAEAQARHYIPCPTCKPPPLTR
jgi:hypothetical protein